MTGISLSRIQPTLLAVAFSFLMFSPLSAQNDGGGNNGGGNNNNGGGGGDGITIETTDNSNDTTLIGQLPGAGVVVNAKGVLSVSRRTVTTDRLDKKRRREAQAKLGAELAKRSDLRKVSLNRLEASVAKRIADQQPLAEEMLYLAGLTKIQYIFFYPDSNDIVLAGPAEGFMLDEMNRPIGIQTGKSVLQLEDLVVALRTFGPDRKNVQTVGCSIDPTQDGLARMQRFLNSMAGRATPRDTRRIVKGLQESLGLQVVTINGISPNTHFANILVEADYRMKLIGIGLEKPPVNITSYVKRASPSAVARNAMQRWYFVPNYDCVHVTDDGLAAELVGDGVKLVNANELVRADGTRAKAATSDRAGRLFVDSFTKRYAELAKKEPVYAQLKNLIDMLIATAYIQEQDFYAQADWDMEIFGNENMMPVEIYAAPKQVETAVNAIWKNRTLMTPVGGGVHINAREAISAGRVQQDDGSIQKTHENVELSQLADGQWWWD